MNEATSHLSLSTPIAYGQSKMTTNGTGKSGVKGSSTASTTYSSPYPTAPPPLLAPIREDPPYIRDDPGLACLTAQLGRINAQIRLHEDFKKRVAEAEEQCKRDLEAKSREAASAAAATDEDNHKVESNKDSAIHLNQWSKYW